jgi:hypothetical protein
VGEDGDLLLSERIGTAALLLARPAVQALAALAEREGRVYGPMNTQGGAAAARVQYDIFRVGVEDGEYLSEDYCVPRTAPARLCHPRRARGADRAPRHGGGLGRARPHSAPGLAAAAEPGPPPAGGVLQKMQAGPGPAGRPAHGPARPGSASGGRRLPRPLAIPSRAPASGARCASPPVFQRCINAASLPWRLISPGEALHPGRRRGRGHRRPWNGALAEQTRAGARAMTRSEQGLLMPLLSRRSLAGLACLAATARGLGRRHDPDARPRQRHRHPIAQRQPGPARASPMATCSCRASRQPPPSAPCRCATTPTAP